MNIKQRVRKTGLKRALLILSAIAICVILNAENVIIKAPGYFDNPIRDGHPLFPDTLCFDKYAEEITFPDMGTFVKLGDYDFPNLRKVTINSVDYVPAAAFLGMKNLEEIVVDGFVGHFDCFLIGFCPNLRKGTFNGPISSTGGPTFAYNCPQLDSVVFNNAVVCFSVGSSPEEKTPKFNNYTINGAIVRAAYDKLTPPSTIDDIKSRPEIIVGMKAVAEWQGQVMRATKDNGWMRKLAYEDAEVLHPLLEQLDPAAADSLKAAMDFAWNLGDDVKSDLDILKESPDYAADTTMEADFVYALPSDSLLTDVRRHFNLDSIAGAGDDISKIMNLLYWVHDNIEHNGGNGFPAGPKCLKNIYYSSKRDSCGYNCRALAIALTEALLAEGIPARYITCQSKKWDIDEDCHVICIAWSESLNKWIWVDPTYAAYVTDETGLLLHPGEVRYRLQYDMPLILNKDANWNNRSIQTKERYLDEYMAKNLYIMSANMLNQAQPEGQSEHTQGYIAGLVPTGSNYTGAHIVTTDSDWFWQPPLKLIEQSKRKCEEAEK